MTSLTIQNPEGHNQNYDISINKINYAYITYENVSYNYSYI